MNTKQGRRKRGKNRKTRKLEKEKKKGGVRFLRQLGIKRF